MLNSLEMYCLHYFEKRYHCYGVSYVLEREILFDNLDSALAYVYHDVVDSVWTISSYLDHEIIARGAYV